MCVGGGEITKYIMIATMFKIIGVDAIGGGLSSYFNCH